MDFYDQWFNIFLFFCLFNANQINWFPGESVLKMSTPPNDPLLQVETTCGTLLYELQVPNWLFYFIFRLYHGFINFILIGNWVCLFVSEHEKIKIIWNEVGETDVERDKMLLELERECLEVYRRKVDLANKCRAQLRQAIADSEAELAAICSAMGERPVHIRQVISYLTLGGNIDTRF